MVTSCILQMIIPCYYGKQCQNMEECPFLHWVGEIKPVTMKKKKSKKGKRKITHNNPDNLTIL